MRNSAFRNESQLRGIVQQRWEKAEVLLSVVQCQSWCELTSYLLGYVLSHLDIKNQGILVSELKQHFASMREQLVVYRQLKLQEVGLIVVDFVEEIKRRGRDGQSSDFMVQETLLGVFYRNLAGTLQNRRYLLQKWERESENERNELLIVQMLEDEERDRRNKAMEKQKQGWECQICLCEINTSSMGLLECGHIFHPECLNGFLKAQIESNNVDIKCPLESCKKQMTPNDIQQYIDGELRQKYEKYTFNKYVDSNPINVSWCPTAGCTAVFEFDEALDNYRCPACKKHYCLKCRCDYHTGMSCAQYRVRHSFDPNDEKFINFVRGAKYKQCPKCKYWVQRNDGCSTMNCKCGQEFCYDCGGTGCPHGRCSNSGGGKKGIFGGLFG